MEVYVFALIIFLIVAVYIVLWYAFTYYYQSSNTIHHASSEEEALYHPSESHTPEVFDPREVFALSSNIFTYKEAESACQAFDASLASQEEMQSAYDKGADWCSYGWSKDEKAFYPTQQKTWDKLQKSNKPAVRNSCGHVGLNGGKFDGSFRFGANCFGVKPSEREIDKKYGRFSKIDEKHSLVADESDLYVHRYRKQRGSIPLLPFNHSTWAQNKA